MPAAQQSVLVNVPPADLMAVLTDFASYPRFLPEMEEAVVLRGEGDTWDVRFAVKVIRRIEYTLRLTREADRRLRWTLVEGAFRANSGSWELTPEGEGTRATYSIDLDMGTFLPGSVVRTLVGQDLPATLAAFKTRAEGR